MDKYYKLVDETNPLPSKKMVFAPGKNSYELRALAMLENMQPDERTKLLGEYFERYEIWYNDQQIALAQVSGDY